VDRFSPNVIVRGLRAFEEYAIETLAADGGSYGFAQRPPCRRSAITTAD